MNLNFDLFYSSIENQESSGPHEKKYIFSVFFNMGHIIFIRYLDHSILHAKLQLSKQCIFLNISFLTSFVIDLKLNSKFHTKDSLISIYFKMSGHKEKFVYNDESDNKIKVPL